MSEEILEVKRFLKMSIGLGVQCRCSKVELQLCSFLGCVHFSTAGTDTEKSIELFMSAEDSMMHSILKFL